MIAQELDSFVLFYTVAGFLSFDSVSFRGLEVKEVDCFELSIIGLPVEITQFGA